MCARWATLSALSAASNHLSASMCREIMSLPAAWKQFRTSQVNWLLAPLPASIPQQASEALQTFTCDEKPSNQPATCTSGRVAWPVGGCYFETGFWNETDSEAGRRFRELPQVDRGVFCKPRRPESSHFNAVVNRICASGRRSALRNKLVRAQVSRVVLVSQR